MFNLLFTILALNLCLTIDRSSAVDTLLEYNCSDSGNYTSKSKYQTNLRALLSSLSVNATDNKDLFYSTKVGGGSDIIYGLFMCTGDDTKYDCRNCVGNATGSILIKCPTSLTAIVWYNDCMVRYSNDSLNILLTSPQIIRTTHKKTNEAGFMKLLGDTMSNLKEDTLNSTKRYATKEAKFDSFLTVYAMAQCTRDISIDECNRCLTKANNLIPEYCNGNKDTNVLTPSCRVRHELYRFYQIRNQTQSLSPPPPPSQPHATLPSSLDSLPSLPDKKKTFDFGKVPILVLVAILVLRVLALTLVILKRKQRSIGTVPAPPNFDYVVSGDLMNVESLQYNWEILRAATNNFSDDNRLGEGGFGVVYKGVLTDGREIAVKRLSTGSSQGAKQFKNEVVFVAKLQHRNLVKLLGFCMAGYEKLLVYEYVSNKSLELFLFDPNRRTELNWPRRSNIIKGIARGMLYLHEDSRLRIIHRDIKASNILLDADMNPKISDFGMARNCKVDESPANTSRIAGTFGYMAPEYILQGEFSTKSDVYSFGVLVLEIITGKRSTGYRTPRVDEHLLTFVWKHWTEGTPLEIIDPCLGVSISSQEVTRCIQVGLLCVQGDTEKRPSIANVAFNLNNFTELSEPEEPAFFVGGITRPSSIPKKPGLDELSSKSMLLSFVSDVSIN